MYQSVTFSCFLDAFRIMDRRDQFSYDGLRALFDYLEEYEDATGEPIELDVVALCCEYSEHDNAVSCAEYYGWNMPERYGWWGTGQFAESEEDYAERCNEAALDWLRDRTSVIEFDSGIIIQDF